MFFLMVILIVIGLVCQYSVTAGSGPLTIQTDFAKQVIWFMIGLVVLAAMLITPASVFYRNAYILYGLGLILLVIALLASSGNVHRWIKLGGFRFQPSEPVKVATVLVLARYFSQHYPRGMNWKRFAAAAVFAAVPALLIVLEPDVGTASVFLALLAVMIVNAGLPWKAYLIIFLPPAAMAAGFHLFTFIGMMVVIGGALFILRPIWWMRLGIFGCCYGLGRLGPYMWSLLQDYQKQRILTFLGMRNDPHGAAYQVIQSKVAIGSGGLLGKGFLHGSQTQLRFLPEQHTDFIFSVLGEEFGFFGIVVVLGLFLILFLRMLRAARLSRNDFARFVIIGCLAVLVFHTAINVSMTVGLMPVTGLSLPFLSYGGSFLLTSMALVGLALNVSSRRSCYE